MWTVEMIRVFLDDLWTRFRGHISNVSAHHSPYTDAEVDAILAVHTAIVNAHHDKYTDAEAVAASEPMVNAIVATHTAIPAAHHSKYTDAEVDAILAVHTAIPAAHHSKYTNAEAIAAVLADDKYVKNTGDTINGKLIITATGKNILQAHGTTYPINSWLRKSSWNGASSCSQVVSEYQGNMNVNAFGTGMTFNIGDTTGSHPYLENYIGAIYAIADGAWDKGRLAIWLGAEPLWDEMYVFTHDHFDMKNKPIKDIKNYTHSALSGTKKLIELKIGNTPYYFEVYPTKA